ncbi:phosphatase PAP2 family protein [Spirillospora sp. CA-128828]|uniref:phosphatase PAP2 family protein n=1 Tax=Spirillospora sp. CA-128828 TaxID=3240033 RepID=UPI003D94975F
MKSGAKRWNGLLVAVMVLVTVDVLADGPLRRLDHIVHEFCDGHIQGASLTAVDVFTKLGQRGVLVAVMVPLALIAAARTRSWRLPLMSAVIVGGVSLLQVVLKAAIPRTYPISETDVLFRRGDAFPSGHTLNAFVLVWVLLELLVVAFPRVRLPPRRRHHIAVTAGMVVAVALTLTDKHWLTDCVFSVALGLVLLRSLSAMDPLRLHGRRPA